MSSAADLCYIQTCGLCLFLILTCRTDFLVTASTDGHVKFWKKQEQGVEFVKHFRAHLGRPVGGACSVHWEGGVMSPVSLQGELRLLR